MFVFRENISHSANTITWTNKNVLSIYRKFHTEKLSEP